MTAIEVVKITVCVDCALLCSNGEVADSDGNDISERVARGQVEIWGTDAWDIHVSDTDDEPFFGKSACEGCGNPNEGDRMHAVVFVHPEA